MTYQPPTSRTARQPAPSLLASVDLLLQTSALMEEMAEDPPVRELTMLDTLPEANPEALLLRIQQEQLQQQPLLSQEAIDAAELT